jgi:hypothetical protein
LRIVATRQTLATWACKKGSFDPSYLLSRRGFDSGAGRV